MDDLATWLRAQLDHHADVHRRLVEAEGSDLPGDREADPDGFWAIWDAHRNILVLWEIINSERAEHGHVTLKLADDMLRSAGLAYQHADGYREKWRPQ